VDHVKLRYHARPLAVRVLGDPPSGRYPSLELELTGHADAVAPGQLACLMQGDWVVGSGTITRR
jgi:tRNA U34 2-thiouridine synthase MnmA/TrmU